MSPLLLLLLCVPLLDCFPDGLVTGSCQNMVPSHGGTGQGSAAPYTVTADQGSYSAGSQVTVTVRATSGSFTGFLLQARPVGQNSPVGSFTTVSSGTQLLTCGGVTNSAVSHTSKSSKTSIQARWTAPSSGNLANIEFRVTVVKSYSVYWTQLKSAAVSYSGSSGSGSSSSSGSLVSSAGCGSSKICFSQPSNCDPSSSSSCFFMSVIMAPDSAVQLEMFGVSPGYVSIGFSDDQQMGNDDVYICGQDSTGALKVQHAYTTGRTAPNVLTLGDVSNINTSLVNGAISCKFTTRNSITTQRSSAGSQYYLMFAYGPSSGGQIQYHTDKMVICNAVNNPPGGTEQYVHLRLDAAGCLMLIAWMTTGSIGMVLARFFKSVTKGTSCLGKDLWFVAHVFLMLLTVAATIIAFILAFVSAMDWSGGAHPVLGCLVMILSFLQPLVAFFRCAPQDHWRFLFNWSHALNAAAIKVLAVAAIFTGLQLISGSSDSWLVKVMGGFVAWEALMFLLQDLNMRWKQKGTEVHTEVVLLVLFSMGNAVFLVSLLVGIGNL
uniref:Uncharacterized protein n=1 Tax=Denticeps clupeoides TaxID=299321 RepID=A0AAY3ZVZ3_9TELE